MILPALQDEDLLLDIRRSCGEPGLHLWWLGQSGFLIQHEGTHFLFDPYLSDSLTQKYANTDKPHVRITERVIAPERLDFIDVVTSSHNHTDHLDNETLQAIFRVNPDLKFIIPEANREFVVNRLGVAKSWPVGMDAGQKLSVSGFTVAAVPAAHPQLERDPQGQHPYLGYIVEFGNWRVYHSGDTVLYDGMTELLHHFQIDIALLPINGAEPTRRVAGNLDGAEAAQLAAEIGAKLVIPCHFEMFEFNTASPKLFEQTARDLHQPFRTLRAGERCTLDPSQRYQHSGKVLR